MTYDARMLSDQSPKMARMSQTHMPKLTTAELVEHIDAEIECGLLMFVFLCMHSEQGCLVLLTCSSRMPSVAEPNLEDSSPFSDSSCKTKAEDDKDKAAPITMASSTVRMAAKSGEAWKTLTRIWVPMLLPTGKANSVKARVHNSICSVPKPNANLARACRHISCKSHIQQISSLKDGTLCVRQKH